MKRLLYTLLLGSFLIPASLVAQDQEGPSVKLLGKWEGSGTLFGQEASFSMYWSEALGGKFLNLAFTNRFTDRNGTERSMEANAWYHLDSGTGYWFDSRGKTLPLTFGIAQDTLTVFWGSGEPEKGKTIYIRKGEQVQVADYVYRENAYAPFGSATYLPKEE